MDYNYLENEYKELMERFFDYDAWTCEAEDASEEEWQYNNEREFIVDIQLLRVLTKMIQIDNKKYLDKLQSQYEMLNNALKWAYIGNTKKERYDRIIASRILLGEAYEYWKGTIEEENSCIFKKISDAEKIMNCVLHWAMVAYNEEYESFAEEIIDNAIGILSQQKNVSFYIIRTLQGYKKI